MRRFLLISCCAFFLLVSASSFSETNVSDPTVGKAGGKSGTKKEDIAGVIRSNLGSLRSCYESLLAKNSKSAGKILMEWSILKTGTVDQARIEMSTINDTDFRKCMIEKISSWKFPKHSAKDPVKISYPFIFSPE